MSKDIPVLLTLDGLAEWLSISPRMAQDLCKDWPCFVLGDRTKRFCPEEVLDYLRQERALKQQHQGETAGLHPSRKLKSVA